MFDAQEATRAPARTLGELDLDALRPTANRVGRLAEALFGATEADVLILNAGRIWRGKTDVAYTDDMAAAELALAGDEFHWIEDARKDRRWRDHAQVQGRNGIRFCAVAPIRLRNGLRPGALRVFDSRPRAFDSDLAERLKDLADIVADECNGLIGYETKMLRDLFEQSPGFMAVLTGPNYVHEMINPAYVALIGPRPTIGLPAARVLPELAGQGFFDRLQEVARTGRPYVGQGVPTQICRRPGRLDSLYLDFVFQPIFDMDGTVRSIFVQGNDVTFEQKAIEALRASQAQLQAASAANQAILDNSHDVICTASADGLFTQVNEYAKEIWGYTPEELLGRSFLSLLHPDDVETTLAMHDQIVAGTNTSTFINRFLHKNGTVVQMSWSAAWSESQASIFAIGRDVSAKLAAEERLRRAQKMEAVGRLTGGVAHDFNNLLTIVVGGAEALTELLDPGTPAHDIAQLTLQAGERGADLVNSLLTFSRGQSLDPTAIDAEALFGSLVPLIRRTLPETIELRVDAHPGSTCLADKSQLESVLMNLCINARDAMPKGGLLRIEARTTEITAKHIEGTGLTPGRYVRLTVSDNGHGMDAKTLEKATEPFFTTKAVGKGTGLGLAMAYGAARQSGGVIRIRSKLGQGATIDLFLPFADAPPTPETVAETPPARMRTTSAKILVVEDDELVRAHLVRLLRDLGYNVVQREDGAAALDVLHRQHDIDLLLTDIVMPGGINGRELAERARVLRPDLRVLFTTGYTDDEIINAGLVYSEADLLRKPYRRAQLAERVDSALSRVEHSLVIA